MQSVTPLHLSKHRQKPNMLPHSNAQRGLLAWRVGHWSIGLFSLWSLMLGCGGVVTQTPDGAQFCREKADCVRLGATYDCIWQTCQDVGACGRATGFPCTIEGQKGACASGTLSCVGGKLTCTTDYKPKKEDCQNQIDDDCNGQIDESPPCSCFSGQRRFCYPEKTEGCLPDPQAPSGYTCKGPCRSGLQICQVGDGDPRWGPCVEIQTPTPEACDNIDNDCNGLVDDENPGGGQSCGVEGKKGPCGIGKTECKSGKIICTQTTQPVDKEICDNQTDDDCNGLVDDTCTCTLGKKQPCYFGPNNTKDIGECRTGEQTCIAGPKWSQCLGSISPSKEICDGLDNDCNGKTDDGLDPTPVPCAVPGKLGECVKGSQKCTNGKLICESNQPPAKEVCDAALKDENCDGKSNENCDCIDGTQIPCISKDNTGCTGDPKKGFLCKGTCRAGTSTCSNGKYGACNGESKPGTELCDDKGLDENCDGRVDEHPTCTCQNGTEQACGSSQGLCTQGKQKCDKGKFGKCEGGILPVAELCDGLDNDCDGQTDEDFPLLQQPCTVAQGVCETRGTYTCAQDKKTAICLPKSTPPTPTKELCNGKDDDCDGKTDEDFPDLGKPCESTQGACKATGQNICKTDGSAIECNATLPPISAERCDGKDNDCDGKIDEDLPLISCGQGNCFNTIPSCKDGKTQTCTPKPATTEICNKQDDDCDGQVDEDGVCGVCTNGTNQTCYNGPSGTEGKGNCKAGNQVCNNGQWGQCSGDVTPTTEICNNQDDDCNGSTDENLTQTCYDGPSGTDGKGLCRVGTKTCTAGTWSACIGEIQPVTEICNNKDDDCDGSVDEGFGNKTCGQGICQVTVQECNNGVPTTCQPKDQLKTKELCGSGQDEDCDGKIDFNDTGDCCLPNQNQRTITNAHSDDIVSLSYNADSTLIASGGLDKNVRVWSATSGSTATFSPGAIPQPVYNVHFSPDKKYLAMARDKKVRVYNTNNWSIRFEPNHAAAIKCVAFNHNSTSFVSAATDKTLKFWKISDGSLLRTVIAPEAFTSIAYSPDGSWLVGTSATGKAYLMNNTTRAFTTYNAHSSVVNSVSFRADSRAFITGSSDHKVRLWSTANTTLVREFAHPLKIHAVAFSPDGYTFTSGGEDKKVYVWKLSDNTQALRTLTGHTDVIDSIAYRPDGKEIASGSKDKTIRFWKCQ